MGWGKWVVSVRQKRIKHRIRINEKEVFKIKLKNNKKFKFRIIRDNKQR